MISALDLFKIGIGPSSSHTVGPMIAARRFVDELRAAGLVGETTRLTIELFGSLAWTGMGHGTDTAIVLGLCGYEPSTIDPDQVPAAIALIRQTERLAMTPQHSVEFVIARDLMFNRTELLPRHSNAMRFVAHDASENIVATRIFYSIGGGFVVAETDDRPTTAPVSTPLPFRNAAELLQLCETKNLSIAEVQLINEIAHRPQAELLSGLDAICLAMHACIDRGLRTDGELPGSLKVKRRACALYQSLDAARTHNSNPAHHVMDWISVYAIAVNEENAAGGRVVTAPTNGAAGIIPAVLRYFRDFCPEHTEDKAREFLLTAAAIGSIIKQNASISGAEVGCQGEVGSAAAMAAAGLTAVLGGTPAQVENAAEMAMEHHLGMTCDPVGGLVQIPCIERNAFGANKAVIAASLALRGDGTHRVSLDEVIETMRQTGADMNTKYKETSLGGLAVNMAQC
jgi:L-serine dehydratase